MNRRARQLATLALSALVFAGCQDPYTTRGATPPVPAAITPGDGERPGPPVGSASLVARHPAHTARAAANAFASRWINWDWRAAASQQRALAALATGTLATQLFADARRVAVDASLRRDKPGSRGHVVATSLTVTRGRARGIVVTREQTSTDGRADLGGQHYHVYRTTLEHSHAGWGVTAWQPQP